MQLPVFDIITQACRDTWENRRDFAAFAFLPVFVVSIVATLMAAVVGDLRVIFDNPGQLPPAAVARMFFGSLADWLARFAVYTVFAVAWHRRTLVGPEATTIGAAMRWGRRHWRFFRRLVFLFVNLFALMFFVSILLRNIIPLGLALSPMLISMGLIYGRVALVLPAAATDTPMTVVESARLTNGNSWRMFLAVVVLPLLVILFGGIAILIVALPLADFIGASMTARFLTTLVAQSVNYIGFAVGITALSLAYRKLTA